MAGDLDARADGGSASTQATNLPARSWQPRPQVAALIRWSRTLFGLAVSMIAVRIAAAAVPRPDGIALTALWLLVLGALSVVIVAAADRLTRRLLPVAALYQLSLVFPDQAPSRFSHALRHSWADALPTASPGDGSEPTVQAEAERLLALVQRLTAHDRRTRGHTERVRAYARLIGEEIGLTADELDKLNWGALLHDIGKLDVPAELLNKPGRPTEEEWAVLRDHPHHAERYVAPLRPWLGEWLDAATQHHERIDGAGYPLGLHGEHISLAARIVAIADAYDVMTSVRSYKPALSPAQARAELTRAAGTQFDAGLVRAFLRVSVARLRLIVGPLGWLSQLPSVLQIPVSTAVTAGGTVVLGLSPIVPTVVKDVVATSPGGTDVAAIVEHANTAAVAGPEELARLDDGYTVPATSPAVTARPGATTDTTADTATSGPSASVPAEAPPTDTTDTTDAPIPTVPTPTATTTPPPPTPTATTTPPPTTTTTTAAPTTTTTTAAPTTTTTTNPPTNPAVDDSGAMGVNGNQVFQVTDNDLFAANGHTVATVEIIVAPGSGTASVVGRNIKHVSSPSPGTVTIVYRACSTTDWCGQATLTIDIT
ncbi:MAG: HD-GYP domain-containing protein [Acidimicrobiia bacterium]